MSLPSPVNPFEESADPRGYVPRFASEEALRGLVRRISAGVPAILLRGPAGIGKSMLLGVLHERLAEDRQIAHVVVSPSPSMEISHQILDLLDENVDADPPSTLVAAARRYASSGRRVLIIIDQATHAPDASSRQLARAATEAGADLCVLFAVTEEEGAEAFEQEIGAEAELATVRFDSPMNAQETSEYIERRLGRVLDSQQVQSRLDEVAIRYVVDGAGGIPRTVNELAQDALRRLESGESLPVRHPEGEASSEPETRDEVPRPDEPPGPPSGSASPPAPGAALSLGGGLLGPRLRRNPSELEAGSALFPPGFLRSGPALPTPPDDVSSDLAASRAAHAGAFPPRAEPAGAPAVAPRTRSKLWMAALVVAAVAGGYLAGRFELVATEPSPPTVATPMPVARHSEPLQPAPERRDRTQHFSANGPTGVAAAKPAAAVEATPPVSAGSQAAPGDEESVAVSHPRAEGTTAKPEARQATETNEQLVVPPPVVVEATPPSAPSDTPRVIVTPKSVPIEGPRGERTSAAQDASAQGQRPISEGPASLPVANDAPSPVDGKVTAIVVGARSRAKPGARAVAYVRVKVELEAGSALTIDGEAVGVAPFSDLIMEPGLHTFVARLPDGLEIEQLIHVTADTSIVEF